MVLRLHGIVQGKRIELDRDPGLPNGSAVSIQIETAPGPMENLRGELDALCGSWADDPSLEGIFKELAEGRSVSSARTVTFNGSS